VARLEELPVIETLPGSVSSMASACGSGVAGVGVVGGSLWAMDSEERDLLLEEPLDVLPPCFPQDVRRVEGGPSVRLRLVEDIRRLVRLLLLLLPSCSGLVLPSCSVGLPRSFLEEEDIEDDRLLFSDMDLLEEPERLLPLLVLEERRRLRDD